MFFCAASEGCPELRASKPRMWRCVSELPELNMIEKVQVSNFSPTSVFYSHYTGCVMMALRGLFAFTLAALMLYQYRLFPVFYFMLLSLQTFSSCGKPAGVSLSFHYNDLQLGAADPSTTCLVFDMPSVFSYLQQLPCLGFSCSSSPSSQFLRTS